MSAQENKALVRRYIEEVHNKGNLYAVEEFFAVDSIDHNALPGTPSGLSGMKQTHAIIHTAFANINVSIEDMVAEGDKVVVRFTASGIHKGEFMGISTTGRQFTIMEIRIYRIAAGKIVEHWGLLDQTDLLQQLGVTSAPE